MAATITLMHLQTEGVLQAGDTIRSDMHGVLKVVSVSPEEKSMTCKPKRGEMLIKFCDLVI